MATTDPLFQVTGLASGIDWGTMIDKVMEQERKITDIWTAEKEKLEFKKDLYDEFSANFKTLRSSLTSLKLSSTYLAKTAEMTNLGSSLDPSSVLSITATPDAEIARYDIEVLQLAQAHSVASARIDDPTKTMADLIQDFTSGSFTIGTGDNIATIQVTSSDTLSSLASKINSAKTSEGESIGVTAKILDNRLILTSNSTGEANAIKVTDTNDILGAIQIWDGSTFTNTLKTAQDAKLKIDGLEVQRSGNEISDLINGLTFNLKGTGHVVADVVLDAEKAVNAISDFVEAYNNAIDWINIRVSEEPIEDPTEDYQKRIGMLRGDPLLWQTKSRLRAIISDPIATSGAFKMLSQIGITTESTDYGKSGKLVFDADKFMEAMTTNSNDVSSLMTTVMTKLDNFIGDTVDNVPVTVGSTVVTKGRLASEVNYLNDRINAIDKRIADFENRLAIKEKGLIEQYSQMETILSQLSQQASWLSGIVSQLGSIGKSS